MTGKLLAAITFLLLLQGLFCGGAAAQDLEPRR